MARYQRGIVGLTVGADLRPRALMAGWALHSEARGASYLIVEVNDYRIVARARFGRGGGRWSAKLYDLTPSELLGFRVFKDGEVRLPRRPGRRKASTVARDRRRERTREAGPPRHPEVHHVWEVVVAGLERCSKCLLERTYFRVEGGRTEKVFWKGSKRVAVVKRRVPPCRRGRAS